MRLCLGCCAAGGRTSSGCVNLQHCIRSVLFVSGLVVGTLLKNTGLQKNSAPHTDFKKENAANSSSIYNTKHGFLLLRSYRLVGTLEYPLLRPGIPSQLGELAKVSPACCPHSLSVT